MFLDELNERKLYVEKLIAGELSRMKDLPKKLFDSIDYSLSTGGKRLRPILFLECFHLFGGKDKAAADIFAAAVEFLHIYTLIHDDLPCMDNDDVRRGKPTNHKVFGETIALLAGDALLNRAYELVIGAVSVSADTQRAVSAAVEFAHLAGAEGVIGGQALEFISAEEMSQSKHIEEIYKKKTCDLLCAAAVCGAVLGGADMREAEIIRKFAYDFGFAFQICDDILDIKEKGHIEKNTFVDLNGLDYANTILEEKTRGAKSVLAGIDHDTSFLMQLADFAGKRDM